MNRQQQEQIDYLITENRVLKEKLGKTVLVITHNGAIAPVADRVIRLRSGQIVDVHRNSEPVPPEEVTW